MNTPTSPLRIAFYCSSTSLGGLELNLIRLAHWMHLRGHQVFFIGPQGSPASHEAIKREIPLLTVNRNRKYFDFRNAYRLSQLLKEHHIKTVFLRDNRDIDLLAITKLLFRSTLNILFHQAMEIGVNKKDWIHTLRFSTIDCWMSTLPWLAQQTRERTQIQSSKIHVIPLGIELSRFTQNPLPTVTARAQLQLPDDAFILGTIGRIDPQKGQHLSIYALNQLQHKYPDLQLVFVGDLTKNEGNHYLLDLKQQIDQANLNHRVHFRPYTPNVEHFYRALDLFAMTSKCETFGTVTIEAMASGLPILGSLAGGTPELLENGQFGTLFESMNEIDFTRQLEHILENREAIRNKANLAQKHAINTYSNERLCTNLEQISKSL